MLKDENFNSNYVYTGLISQTKQVNDAYWMPKNISVNKIIIYFLNKIINKICLISIIIH